MKALAIHFSYVALFFVGALAQNYEDKRCRCVCPSPAMILNKTQNTDWRLYIANVPPSKCNCDGVILPNVGDEIKGREQEFCPRCECKYESRNTTVIMVVVMMVIVILTFLMIYMAFLICLEPLINKNLQNKKRLEFYNGNDTEETQNLLSHLEEGED